MVVTHSSKTPVTTYETTVCPNSKDGAPYLHYHIYLKYIQKNYSKISNDDDDNFIIQKSVLRVQLIPLSTVLLVKLTVIQLFKKFLSSYSIQRIITMFTTAYQRSLTSARQIQSIPSYPIALASILISSSCLHTDLPSGLVTSGFAAISTTHDTYSTHFMFLNLITNIWQKVQIL